MLGLKCKELENSGDFVDSKDYTCGRLSNVNTLLMVTLLSEVSLSNPLLAG